MNVARRSNTHSTLKHRTEVGDDVSKQVGRDDDVEPFRVLDHPHAACVYVGVVRFHLGEILRHMSKRPRPQIVRPYGVGLVD